VYIFAAGGGGGLVLLMLIIFVVLHHKKKSAQVHPNSKASKEHFDPKTPIADSVNEPGAWHFFISHTQRDEAAKLIATELWAEFKASFHATCWLDVKMEARDMEAMKEGIFNSDTCICIVTNNGKEEQSYFSRPMCRQEIMWAVKAGKAIVPVVKMDDKPNIGKFIAEANTYKENKQLPDEDPETAELPWPDFGKLNFTEFDRGSDLMTFASLKSIIRQHKTGIKKDGLINQHGKQSGLVNQHGSPGARRSGVEAKSEAKYIVEDASP